MAIRCSVLGHDWGDPEIERARERRGTKLVVAERRVRTCGRCGAEEVLDEQTEDAIPPGAEPDDETESEEDAESAGETDAEPARPPEEDDGVILTEDTEIGSGEWPDPGIPESSDAEYEPRPWPDAEPPDPGEQGSGDSDVIEAAGPAGERRSPAGEPVDPAEVLSAAAEEQSGPDDDPDPDGEGPDPEDLPLEDVEVYCPNCQFADETPLPSLRGGDSCPNCRDSYLEERDA